MLTVGDRAPNMVIEHWMAAWFDLLGRGRLAEAVEQLDRPDGDGVPWTPDRLTAIIEEHFGEGTYFRRLHPEGPRLTPAATATGSSQASIVALVDGSGFNAIHSVPLNGEFSDLVAESGGVAQRCLWLFTNFSFRRASPRGRNALLPPNDSLNRTSAASLPCERLARAALPHHLRAQRPGVCR